MVVIVVPSILQEVRDRISEDDDTSTQNKTPRQGESFLEKSSCENINSLPYRL